MLKAINLVQRSLKPAVAVATSSGNVSGKAAQKMQKAKFNAVPKADTLELQGLKTSKADGKDFGGANSCLLSSGISGPMGFAC